MADLLSYSLTDFLPFSQATYRRLFELYNTRFWPAVAVGLLLGLQMLWRSRRPSSKRLRSSLVLLGACWIWVAWAFLIESYLPLSWAAGYAAAAFAVQGLLLCGLGVAEHSDDHGVKPETAAIGIGYLVIAVLVLPALGYWFGRSGPGVELFGSTPDPTCLGTLGVVLMVRARFRALLMVVPVAWSAISALTLLALDDPLWPLLPVAAVVAIVVAVTQNTVSGVGPGTSDQSAPPVVPATHQQNQ